MEENTKVIDFNKYPDFDNLTVFNQVKAVISVSTYYNEKYRNIKWVECPYCGYRSRCLSTHIKKIHTKYVLEHGKIECKIMCYESSHMSTKLGKNNPAIVRVLLKVVIEDIEYEIFLTQDYVQELKDEIKRLKQVEKYKISMDKAKKEKDKNYYLEGMKILLKNDETPENFQSAYEQYKKAYETRKAIIENLYNEIKIIKKLKI